MLPAAAEPLLRRTRKLPTMSDEMEEEMQDLRDELDETQGQLELAAQMGADLVETNERLEEVNKTLVKEFEAQIILS